MSLSAAAFLFFAAAAPPVQRPPQVTVVARARIVEAARIDLSGRTVTRQARAVRRGLIEFE